MPQTIDQDGVTGGTGTSLDGSGGYDLEELKRAHEALSGSGDVDTAGMEEVEPLYIEVMANRAVAYTEEYEARMVIVEYDDMDNIVGVELL